MNKIKAFANGIKEFKNSETTHYDENLIDYYDFGRELAHKFTFRIYEN